ncbi:MAG: putative collagen-binding domain-containing protein, partial [Myxococcota bacterium]
NTNTPVQVKSFADYFAAVDPYRHPVVMHTYPNQHDRYDDLLGHPTFNGPTLQYGGIPESASGGLYGETRDLIESSANAGVSWFVTATEASGSDAPTPFSPVTSRQRVYWMWANPMAGGGGIEWYLKNAGAGHAYDLAVEDQREFDAHWTQTGHLVRFFRDVVQETTLDLEDFTIDNGLTGIGSDWVLADRGRGYILFLRNGGSVSLTTHGGGSYRVSWFNPRTGAISNRPNVGGSGDQSLGAPPSDTGSDWVVFVRR